MNIKKILGFCILFILFLNFFVYINAMSNVNSKTAKSVLSVKSKDDLVKELKYVSKRSSQQLIDYNLSFLSVANFMEKSSFEKEREINDLKIASLKAYSNKSVKENVLLLKQQTGVILTSLLYSENIKNKEEVDSELIDAFIINESLSEKNYGKEIKKLFNQLAVIFGTLK